MASAKTFIGLEESLSTISSGDTIIWNNNTWETYPYLFKTINTITEDYNCNLYDNIIFADAISNNINIYLPNPTTNSGQEFIIKKIDNSINTVTIMSSGYTIDGYSNYILYFQYETIKLISNGTNYFIINSLNNYNTDVRTVHIQGNGNTIPTNTKGRLYIGYSANIVYWRVYSSSGSVTVNFNVNKNGSDIVGSGNKPYLSNEQERQEAVSGWLNNAVTNGDYLDVTVNSNSNATDVYVVFGMLITE